MSGRRSSVHLSLFPFLAVLICTMGVLVALLLLVVKQADQSAKNSIAEIQQEIEQQIDSIQTDMAVNELRSSVMTEARLELIEKVQKARALRSHLDNEIAQLSRRGEQLELEVAAFQRSQQNFDLSAMKEELRANLQELQVAKSEAAKLEDEVGQSGPPSSAPVYSIVPMAAKNGTDRRPIYIECDQSGVTLYPGGHHLGPEDFVVPLQAGNPLDSALIAYREQWRAETKDSDGAYPLMVVRPSGAQWYAVVRRAMQSWEDEFGYELVPEDWEVDFGESDSELDQRVTQSIDLALNRQNTLVNLGRARRLNDQIENLDSQSIVQQTPAGLVPSSTGGFAAVPASHSTTDRMGSYGAYGSGNLSSQGAPVDPLASLSADYHRSRSLTGLNSQGVSASNDPLAPSPLLPADSNVLANRTPPGSAIAGHSVQNAPGMTHSFASPFSSSLQSGPATASNAVQSQGNSDLASSGKSRQTIPNSTATNGRNGFNNNTAQGATTGPTEGGNSSGNYAMGTTGFSSAEQQSQTTQTASSQSGPGQLHQESLARQRGTDWALPSRRPNVSAYHRPIAVELDSQKIVFQSGIWNRETMTIPLDAGLEASIDVIIDGVWKRVASWGNLGFDGYWKPVLAIRTSPANLSQVRQLEALLDGSGLTIERVEQ